ncbi:uncharacterized protein LOC124161324 [Ischnura elegans]|uniref:uncharacterized protein LOC124161324 n=1 Tax=Ischnura elegans TaxID=197161 RepID=UPI001ED8B534|nr:uncharacterized protein LOC124161324 [Ischnura elegans]
MSAAARPGDQAMSHSEASPEAVKVAVSVVANGNGERRLSMGEPSGESGLGQQPPIVNGHHHNGFYEEEEEDEVEEKATSVIGGKEPPNKMASIIVIGDTSQRDNSPDEDTTFTNDNFSASQQLK